MWVCDILERAETKLHQYETNKFVDHGIHSIV